MDIEVCKVSGFVNGYQAVWFSDNGYKVKGEVCDTPKEAVLTLIENFDIKCEAIIKELQDAKGFMANNKYEINQMAPAIESMLKDMPAAKVSIEPSCRLTKYSWADMNE